ncbi:MAG: hypothetical protein JWN45_290 [Acidobacteriaceae bacterium]|nr:hypothetical protein [Acidobacteriaceae bacterium]
MTHPGTDVPGYFHLSLRGCPFFGNVAINISRRWRETKDHSRGRLCHISKAMMLAHSV